MSAAGSPFTQHDHHHCTKASLAEAEALAAKRGARLTPVRRRTLEILLESHQAMGAYEVLARLGEDGFGRQPPVAYRALEFLVDLGVVHRVQMLNAFAACTHPSQAHEPAFLICRACNILAEAPAAEIRPAVEASAATLGFAVERMNLEVVGLCPNCAKAS